MNTISLCITFFVLYALHMPIKDSDLVTLKKVYKG